MDGRRLPRRGFFRIGLVRAARAAADAMSEIGRELSRSRLPGPRRSGARPYRSRPPGAVEGDRFLALCTKCNDCVAACPAWAIRKADEHEAEPGYPLVEPNVTACAVCEEPLPCIAACATGALVATPRASIRLGLARLDPDRCVVPRGETCDFCVTYCPVPEAAIRMTEDGPVILEPGCTGCGMCAVMCPEEALRVAAAAAG